MSVGCIFHTKISILMMANENQAMIQNMLKNCEETFGVNIMQREIMVRQSIQQTELKIKAATTKAHDEWQTKDHKSSSKR